MSTIAKRTDIDSIFDERYPFLERLSRGKKFLSRFGINISDLSDEDIFSKIRKIADYKEASIQVLSRGQVLDSYKAALAQVQAGLVGNFFNDDPMSIARAKAKGWEIFEDKLDDEDNPSIGADGRVRIGDSILMIMSEEKYVGLILAKEERNARKKEAHNMKGKNVPQGDGEVGVDPLMPLSEISLG